MPGAFRLASLRTAWLCAAGTALLLVPFQSRADDPADSVVLPVPALDSADSKQTDDKRTSTPLKSSDKDKDSELAAAKKHVRNQPLNQVRASIAPPAGELPDQDSLDDLIVVNGLFTGDQSRPWAYSNYEWEAPATKHLPLLFEEPNLERLGYAYGMCDVGICEEEPRRGQRLQTLVSGVNFFGRIPFIPYMAGVRPLTEPVYTLGADRPGSPVPYRKYLAHCSARGVVYQAGAMVGTAFIIP